MKTVRRCGSSAVQPAPEVHGQQNDQRAAFATPGAVPGCGLPCCVSSFGRVCAHPIGAPRGRAPESYLGEGPARVASKQKLHVEDRLIEPQLTVCDKKITYITFFCFELIDILHNMIVAMKYLIFPHLHKHVRGPSSRNHEAFAQGTMAPSTDSSGLNG